MTDHTPLTDQQLNDIETRANAATPGPWERYTEYGPTFFANTTGEYLRGVGDLNFGVGDQAEADEEFVKHAREDVEQLVAEVRRLRAAADRVRALAILEAANFLRTAHFNDGLSVQEIGTALRATVDDADPMVGSLARDGFGADEIADILDRPSVPAVEAGE